MRKNIMGNRVSGSISELIESSSSFTRGVLFEISMDFYIHDPLGTPVRSNSSINHLSICKYLFQDLKVHSFDVKHIHIFDENSTSNRTNWTQLFHQNAVKVVHDVYS